MNKDKQNNPNEWSLFQTAWNRRDFIKKPLALAAGSLLLPSWVGNLQAKAVAARLVEYLFGRGHFEYRQALS